MTALTTMILMAFAAVAAGVTGSAIGHARGTAAGRQALAGSERARAIDRAAAAERESALRERLARSDAAAHTDDQLVEVIRSVSAATMAEQSDQLLRLAETRYRTLEQSSHLHWREQGEVVVSKLGEYAARLHRLEEQRHGESAVLRSALSELRRSNEEIRSEARGLAAAMKDNKVRGTWGEMQLRRVLEQSGMAAHSDFVEQQSVTGADRSGRPDVIVRLPNDRCVVIDAKAPLDSYLRASNCDDPADRAALVAEHARAVASHVTALSRRGYDDMVPGAVDFVVMFIPGDAFLSAAFEARPGLLEEAASQNVILASPSTLLAFLRGMAVGWRERTVAAEADVIAQLGRELHERVAIFAEHFVAVGGALGKAVGSYNRALGSMETRLLVTARRLEEHAAGSRRPIPDPLAIGELPASPSATELTQVPEHGHPTQVA